MVISVNGHPLALKKGSSFEYISENRLFSGSDAYTLSITFPLKDCPQNIEIFGHINRKDVSLGKIIFDCEIRDKTFYKFGSLTVVEISESEVKCQFLEGRSETNYDKTFDKVYINELNLGQPEIFLPSQIAPGDAFSPSYNDNKYVALPWVNNNSDSGMPHNFVDLHVIEDYEHMNYYTWAEDTKDLTWQPYLIHIIKMIGKEINYDIDLSSLEKDINSRYLLICNTLPGSWDIHEFARALPHWTVDEFFTKLELFLGGEFTIDHRNKKIRFDFTKDILQNLSPVEIDKVVKEFSSQIDSDESNCEYIDVKNLAYNSDDSQAWKYYSCDWFVKERIKSVVTYATISELISENRWMSTWRNTTTRRNTNFNKLLYAEDVDTYFIIRTLSGKKVGEINGNDIIDYKCILQPVNIFGERIVNESEDANEEEIEFMPVSIDYTDDAYGWCIFLNVGAFDETSNHYLDIPSSDMTGTQSSLLAGSKDSNSEYYDKIYLGWWPGVTRTDAKMPYPIVDSIEVKDDWSRHTTWSCFNMRLTGAGSSHSIIHKIDPKRKVSFKFLADTIPDVRAVFFIRGKRYICEKITATFRESGMSQLLKGDFYQIID
ncbi:MAG: hypothetical protein J1E16_05755 [Muribaculaceae bacterium]|nr:hypothetical protein [Muribaculaceae bacterium]